MGDPERFVYGVIRENTGGPQSDWIDKRNVYVHCVSHGNLATHEVDRALKNLDKEDLIETDRGRYRPTDRDYRIPHPGEV